MQAEKNIVVKGAAGLPITLDVFYEDSANQQPVVVYAHGFNGFKDWGNFDLVARRFAEAGFVFVKFNFSHNGTTPDQPGEFADLDAFGKNNYTIQLSDLKTITNWICDPANLYAAAMDPEQLYLIGHSMGGGIATIFASEDSRIKKLVTWAGISECKTPWGSWPAAKIKEWKATGVQYYTNTRTNQQMPLYYQLYEDYQNNKERLSIKKAIENIVVPVLICHGSNDLSVPEECAHQLTEWQPGAELFIVDGNHVFDRRHPWIMNYLPEAMEEVVGKTISFLLHLTYTPALTPKF